MSVYAFADGLNSGLNTGLRFAIHKNNLDRQDRIDQRNDLLFQQQQEDRQFNRKRLEAQDKRSAQAHGLSMFNNRMKAGKAAYGIQTQQHERNLSLLGKQLQYAQHTGNKEAQVKLQKAFINAVNNYPQFNINHGAPEGGKKVFTGLQPTEDGRYLAGIDTLDKNGNIVGSGFLSQKRSADPADPYITFDKDVPFKLAVDNPDFAQYMVDDLLGREDLKLTATKVDTGEKDAFGLPVEQTRYRDNRGQLYRPDMDSGKMVKVVGNRAEMNHNSGGLSAISSKQTEVEAPQAVPVDKNELLIQHTLKTLQYQDTPTNRQAVIRYLKQLQAQKQASLQQ